MSELQTSAKGPILRLWDDDLQSLDEVQQEVVARWAVMTTMVIEHAHPDTMASTFSQRQYLCKNKAIPNEWTVWIARFSPTLWPRGFNHFAWGHSPWGRDPSSFPALAHRPDTQSTAFPIGNILFMTFSTSFDEARVDGPAFADKFGMRCIWPTHEKTLIRPNERLNDLAANDASAALVPSGMVKRLAWETV